jgi:hypothetical protein
MATKDGFPPDDGFPLFLSEHAEKTEQQDIGKAWDRAVVSSRILKTSILVVTAAVIGIAILSVRSPVALLANVTASLVDKSALQPGTDQSTPTIQSIAGTQDSPPTARDAPTRDEIAAASEPADQSQTEISQPPVEASFKQFQAWAAEEDTRAQVGPVQDAKVQVVQDAPAQVRPMKKHRHVKPVHNARAEIRPAHNARAKAVQNARAQMRREQNTQAPVQPVQNAQPPSLLQSLGWQN